MFAAYFIFVVILSLFTAGECKQLKFYAIYLTNWNVVLNGTSALFGAILITFYYRGKIRLENDKMPNVFKLYWLLVTSSTVLSATISGIYWPFIYVGRDKGLNDALSHAGNTIFMIIDIFINAHPPRFGHFIYPLSFGMFYVFIFSIPYTLLGGTDRDYNNFIYSVLDWRNNTSGALSFSLAAIVFIIMTHFVLTSFGVFRLYISKVMKSRKTEPERSTNEENNRGFSESLE